MSWFNDDIGKNALGAVFIQPAKHHFSFECLGNAGFNGTYSQLDLLNMVNSMGLHLRTFKIVPFEFKHHHLALILSSHEIYYKDGRGIKRPFAIVAYRNNMITSIVSEHVAYDACAAVAFVDRNVYGSRVPRAVMSSKINWDVK